jgi:hypothetical protein
MSLSTIKTIGVIVLTHVALTGSVHAQTDTKDRMRDGVELAACLKLGPACTYYGVGRVTLSPTPTAPADRTDTFIRMPETGEIVANPQAMQFASPAERNRMTETARRLSEQTRQAETARYDAALSQVTSRYQARLEELQRRLSAQRLHGQRQVSDCYNNYLAGRISASVCSGLQRQYDEQQRLLNDAGRRIQQEQQEMVQRLGNQYRQ